MSTTFSLVVYVKPPHARPNTPSAMRIIPIVFITPSSPADSGRAPRPSSSFLKAEQRGAGDRDQQALTFISRSTTYLHIEGRPPKICKVTGLLHCSFRSASVPFHLS